MTPPQAETPDLPTATAWHAGMLPALPAFLRKLIDQAAATLDVRRIAIFGSRATGRHRPTSDYDLAFFLDSDRNWADFVTSRWDDLESLVPVDYVDAAQADAHLKAAIASDGVTIYERR